MPDLECPNCLYRGPHSPVSREDAVLMFGAPVSDAVDCPYCGMSYRAGDGVRSVPRWLSPMDVRTYAGRVRYFPGDVTMFCETWVKPPRAVVTVFQCLTLTYLGGFR